MNKVLKDNHIDETEFKDSFSIDLNKILNNSDNNKLY